MADYDSGTRDLFLAEAQQLLSSLQSLLLDAERDDSFSSERIAELFRLVHTLKGSAAMMGYTALSDATHRFEDVLSHMRDMVSKSQPITVEMTKQTVSLGLDFSDVYQNAVTNPGEYMSAEAFSALNDRIAKMHSAADITEKSDAKSGGKKHDAYPPELYRYERLRIRLIHCGMASIRAYMIASSIHSMCEECYTMPSDIERRPECDEQILKDGFELGYIRKGDTSGETIMKTLRRQPMFGSFELIAAANKPQPVRRGKNEELLTVKANSVTYLLGLITEAMSAEALLSQQLKKLGVKDAYIENMQQELRKTTTEIQNRLGDMGLVEIGQTFLPMKRLVRKILQETHKKAEVTVSGGEIMVDRGVLDALNEALLHLVRNSVDHGIEPPEERAASGKSETGNVDISAKSDRGRLIVKVRDDGRGIDRTRILKKAKDLGLLTKPENEYTQKELYGFILRSGFSTTLKISQYSGRGVGLDVVHNSLSKIGGSMSIESSHGNGTVITLNLPVSLASMEALSFTLNDREFYIPAALIRSIAAWDSSQRVGERGEIISGGETYFPIGVKPTRATSAVILFSGDIKKYYISCDSLGDYGTVLAQKMPDSAQFLLGNRNIYLGYTIDTMGRVRCILDVDMIIKNVQAREASHETIS